MSAVSIAPISAASSGPNAMSRSTTSRALPVGSKLRPTFSWTTVLNFRCTNGGLFYQHLERFALSNQSLVALPDDERFDQMNAAILQSFKSSLTALRRVVIAT